MGIGPIDVPAMETLLRDAGAKHPASGPAAAQEATTAHRKRRWTINGDFVNLNPNGVARYAREVTLALDALIAEGHPLARGLVLDLVAPRGDESLQLKAI